MSLHQFIRRYIEIPDKELHAFVSLFKKKSIKKYNYLYREGDVCHELVFLNKGCLRFFYMPHEVEISVWFSFPFTIGSEIQSYISGKPCKFSVQAIQNTEYLYLSKSAFEMACQQQPLLHLFYNKLCEECIVDVIDRLISFQSQTADQRYLELMKEPDYLKLIPQKYLASYLGVTPTSLSRLRRKISHL
jgi:CRP-like cAMP-binding protein